MTKNLASKLPDIIKADRLTLRAPTMADAPALHQLANNKSIHKFLSALPFPYTRAHAIDFITKLARAKNEHAFAITTPDDDLVGVIAWHLDREIGLELGYWIGEPFWGKGYATLAVSLLINATQKFGHRKFFARAMTGNPGSIRVLEKSGFIKISEGIDDCGIHKGIHMSVFKWEPVKENNHG